MLIPINVYLYIPYLPQAREEAFEPFGKPHRKFKDIWSDMAVERTAIKEYNGFRRIMAITRKKSALVICICTIKSTTEIFFLYKNTPQMSNPFEDKAHPDVAIILHKYKYPQVYMPLKKCRKAFYP